VLVRDYQGQRHTVTVAPDGFDWQGTTYPSLSAIARAITGTAWSGPRFFALHGAGDQSRNNRSANDRQEPVTRPRRCRTRRDCSHSNRRGRGLEAGRTPVITAEETTAWLGW
jgi:hypothetical protein